MYRDEGKRRAYQREYYHRTKTRKAPQMPAEKKILFTMRIAASMVARMQRLASEGLLAGKYPWKTTTQVAQALLLKGLESMAGDPDVDEALPYLRTVNSVENIAQHRTEAQAAFSKIKIEIAEMLTIGAKVAAVQYFHAMYQSCKEMSKNVWRDWLLQKLETTFPELLKQKPKGVVLDTEPEEVSPRRKAQRSRE